MKRLICLILALLLAAALATTAFADVIFEPVDSFYRSHQGECDLVDRTFTTRIHVQVYKSPESPKIKGMFPPDQSIWISHTYEDPDGNLWGYTEIESLFGWVPMAYLELQYDFISFQEDHASEITDQEGTLDERFANAEAIIYCWDYPGSTGSTLLFAAEMDIDQLPHYSQVYQDGQSRNWGFVNYHFGARDFWICLDDPTADFDALFPDGAPETPPQETTPLPEKQIVPKIPAETIVLRVGITLAVAACVIITAVILKRMKKKDE